MTLITTTKELKAFCKTLKDSEFITIDTEFMREKTYWPKLCLIQVAGSKNFAAIDPLAKDIDLKSFYKLLQDEKILKVMHGCRQDIEIFYLLTGKIPTPLFDTQIAGMVCGFGDQISYEKLIKALVDERIDKTSRYTDWSRRPLTDKQLSYALSDVTHLRPAYEKLRERVDKFERISWLDDEFAVLGAPETYENKPEEAWHRIKIHSHHPRTLGILREVAAWRERMAQKKDVPRGRILRDDLLAEIASHPPTKMTDLKKIRNFPSGYLESEIGHQLLAATKHGMNIPEEECPHRKKKPPMPAGLGPTIDLLRVLLKTKCEKHMVAPKLLASASDLELIAAFDDAKVRALSGWRREVFGEDALNLKHGKLALSIDEHREVKLARI